MDEMGIRSRVPVSNAGVRRLVDPRLPSRKPAVQPVLRPQALFILWNKLPEVFMCRKDGKTPTGYVGGQFHVHDWLAVLLREDCQGHGTVRPPKIFLLTDQYLLPDRMLPFNRRGKKRFKSLVLS